MKHSKDDTVIHINERWAFEGDSLAVNLYEKRVSENGKLNFFVKGYYQNIADMFYRLVDMEVNTAMTRNIENVHKVIKDIKFDIFLCILNLARQDTETIECLTRPYLKEPKEITNER